MILIIFNHFSNKRTTSVLNQTKGEWIVASFFNTEGKSNLISLDTKNHKIQTLLSNKDVMVQGKLNSKGNILVYNDSIGSNQWNTYKLNLTTKVTSQITNDEFGEFNIHLGNENGTLIFAKSGNKQSPIPRIKKIDTDKNSSKFFDLGSDVAIQDFDVRDKKIIAITFSFSDFINKRFKQKDPSTPIKYTLVKLNLDGEVTQKICEISAIQIDSILFSSSSNFAVLGGKGILKNEKGFYKVDLESGVTSVLLTDEEVKKTNNIADISQPYIPCLSADEKKIYFIGIPIGAEKKKFAGLMAFNSSLYSYDLKEKKLNDVLEIKDSFISSISLTYQ